jgi:hypothetical protein
MLKGTLIALAFPETAVKIPPQWYKTLFKVLGLSNRGYIRAGHAALCLINHEDESILYSDFGRYITPKGHGRARTFFSDPEVVFPFKAQIASHEILNLEEILLFLWKEEELTHGEGPLFASVYNNIDYHKSFTYIRHIQKLGTIPYGPFVRKGSNCSRFVKDSIKAGTSNPLVLAQLFFNGIPTISPLGNLRPSLKKFKVQNGKVKRIGPIFFGAALNNFMKKPVFTINDTPRSINKEQIADNAQWLSGQGSGSWFELSIKEHDKGIYNVKRFDKNRRLIFNLPFIDSEKKLHPGMDYTFIFPTHAELVTISQSNREIRLIPFEE